MPHQKKFRLAFVGGAPNSAVGYAHFVATRMDGLWDLQAGAFSRHAEVNAKAAEIYGVPRERSYGGLAELLDKEGDNLDAVSILTPTPDHFGMVLDCLQRGLPVICEKALAMTSGEATKIRDICSEKKGFLAVIYNYSGYPMVRELRKMIRDGVLGEILHFQVEMPQEGFLRVDDQGNKPVPQEWRKMDGRVPTLHLDLAVHLHELVTYCKWVGGDPSLKLRRHLTVASYNSDFLYLLIVTILCYASVFFPCCMNSHTMQIDPRHLLTVNIFIPCEYTTH